MVAGPGSADFTATKRVFISAIRFATSADGPCPTLGYGPRVSAQEQVDHMLAEGECMLADREILNEARMGLSRALSSFERQLSEPSSDGISRCLSDLEWTCEVSTKMGIMADFVSGWIDLSENLLRAFEARGVGLGPEVRSGIARVAGRVLDAVGYGSVIVPAARRGRLVKVWLGFVGGWEVDGEVWEGIEGAVVSIVSGLPSEDQAEILAEWMSGGGGRRYPDLSDALKVWCFRSKAAKRLLGGGGGGGGGGMDGVG